MFTGASHKLEDHAVIQRVTALHASIGAVGEPSVSTQIAALRTALLGKLSGTRGEWYAAAANGTIPLVVDVHQADHIATLLELKVCLWEFLCCFDFLLTLSYFLLARGRPHHSEVIASRLEWGDRSPHPGCRNRSRRCRSHTLTRSLVPSSLV